MTKVSWIAAALIVAAAGGGGAVYLLNQRVEEPAAIAPAPALTTPVAEPNPAQDHTEKKIDGIGNTRTLKPVQIPQGPAR